MSDANQEERERLYFLFILHAFGRHIVMYTCPNCGDLPHMQWKENKTRLVFKCLQCQCISSKTEENKDDQHTL